MATHLAGGIASAIMIILAVLGIVTSVLVLRPMVDYRIVDFAKEGVPEKLVFLTLGDRAHFSFEVRNRGGSDAPVIVNITVVNAYVGKAEPLNSTKPIVFYAVLTARSDNYGRWDYYIVPIGEPSTIEIEFRVTKNWRQDTSGIINWFFGEYNAWHTHIVYQHESPGLYKLVSA